VLFQRFSSDRGFASAVREMRSKVESGSERNLKTSPGAIYDIDFLCSYLSIFSGTPEKAGTLRDRIWRCADSGALTKPDASALDHAAEFLRTVEHVVRLVTGRAGKWLPVTDHALHLTAELTASILGPAISTGLGRKLDEVMQAVREIYARLLTDCPAPG
jgi:glutamine synthetase adenylyltransferase